MTEAARRAPVWLISAASAVFMCSCPSPDAPPTFGHSVSIGQIADGIQSHIAAKTNRDGGYFKLKHGDKLLLLELESQDSAQADGKRICSRYLRDKDYPR